jgi:hypothetical protein
VHRKAGDKDGIASTVEDGASVMFKANAKRTKNMIVSSVPLLAVSAAAVDVGVKRKSVVAAAANLTAKALVSSAPPTPKKGNSCPLLVLRHRLRDFELDLLVGFMGVGLAAYFVFVFVFIGGPGVGVGI